jgi:hypothetical protein
MKTKILLLALFSIHFCATAQITTKEISTEKEYKKPIVYDSTYFFYKPDVDFKEYVNQRIYILPKSETNKNDGSRFFYKKDVYNSNLRAGLIYQPILDSLINGNQIKHSTLENKYLKIVDIKAKSDWEGYITDFSIKLYDEENQDTIFYCPTSSRSLTGTPFILVGFFEYSKNKFVGNDFIAKDSISEYTSNNGYFTSEPLIDINSGEKIKCMENSKWTCTEITLVDVKRNNNYFIPVLVFKDNLNREIIVNFAKYIYNKDYYDEKNIFSGTKATIDNFYSKEEYEFLKLQKQEQEKLKIQKEHELEIAKQKRLERLISMYGSKYANLIVNEKVSIGMTKEMCEEAWGTPFETDKVILENGTYEVWLYSYKTFLYFEKDILKLIKE